MRHTRPLVRAGMITLPSVPRCALSFWLPLWRVGIPPHLLLFLCPPLPRAPLLLLLLLLLLRLLLLLLLLLLPLLPLLHLLHLLSPPHLLSHLHLLYLFRLLHQFRLLNMQHPLRQLLQTLR